MIKIFTDGATEGPNGRLGTVTHCGIGFYCKDTGFRYSKRIEAISNNEAEFYALIAAMEWASNQEFNEVAFYLDSKIVVNRANGRRPRKEKFKNERMDRFQDMVLDIAGDFKVVTFNWLPREQNMIADFLSKKSLKTYPH